MLHRRPNYRPDIDGLRAIAVITVVAFHFFPGAAPGGFIGVDVFFVISGFLISSIIFQDNEAERFSFAQFYARRVLRIFPALLTVLASCLLLGWLVLPGYLLDNLGRETIAGTLFSANFFFWNESGYFNSEAASKPLLHLWSLGVEEQFYLLWPAVLYLCSRRRWASFAVIAIVCAASYLHARSDIRSDPIAVFYLPQYRFWELMLGALYAHPLSQHLSKDITSRFADVFSIAGLLGIICSVLLLDGHVTFSGRYAFPSTVGALLVIAGGGGWINRRLLSQRVAVFIGKISYPLYLWHWPLLYFYKWSGRQFVYGNALVMGLSILLSIITYLLIERPLQRRKASWLPLLKTSAGSVAAMAAIAVFCAVAVEYRGFPDRQTISLSALPAPQAKLEADLMRVYAMRFNFAFADLYGDKPCFRYKETQTAQLFLDNGCLEPEFGDRPNVFIFGDSHAAALSIGLKPLLASRRINLERLTYGWCTPTDGRHNKICDDMNAMALARIGELKPDVVILDSYWLSASKDYRGQGDYKDGILALVSDIRSRGARHVIVVGQMPLYDYTLPQRLIADYVEKSLPIPERVTSAVPSSLAMDDVMRKIPYPDGVEYISLRGALCNEEGCLDAVGPDVGQDILLWDYGHLTRRGSEYIARTVMEPVILGRIDKDADQK